MALLGRSAGLLGAAAGAGAPGSSERWRRYLKPSATRAMCCSGGGSSSSDAVPVQDAVLKAISEVSKAENRVAQTTNVVMGGAVVVDEWRALDNKVNTYPMERGFTAIGTGGADFVRAMVLAVETDEVSSKLSAKGKYISVKIGPVAVQSSEQVRAVYNAMRCDSRMKYFL